jgi:hypothetical protein
MDLDSSHTDFTPQTFRSNLAVKGDDTVPNSTSFMHGRSISKSGTFFPPNNQHNFAIDENDTPMCTPAKRPYNSQPTKANPNFIPKFNQFNLTKWTSDDQNNFLEPQILPLRHNQYSHTQNYTTSKKVNHNSKDYTDFCADLDEIINKKKTSMSEDLVLIDNNNILNQNFGNADRSGDNGFNNPFQVKSKVETVGFCKPANGNANGDNPNGPSIFSIGNGNSDQRNSVFNRSGNRIFGDSSQQKEGASIFCYESNHNSQAHDDPSSDGSFFDLSSSGNFGSRQHGTPFSSQNNPPNWAGQGSESDSSSSNQYSSQNSEPGQDLLAEIHELNQNIGINIANFGRGKRQSHSRYATNRYSPNPQN